MSPIVLQYVLSKNYIKLILLSFLLLYVKTRTL
jgi:hypothetical protein